MDIYGTTERKTTYKKTGEKARDELMIANFTAEITTETVIKDGLKESVIFTIKGENASRKFPTIEVPAHKFASLAWVTSNWGATAVIMPTPGAAADFRTAVQLLSTNIKSETIFQHTGWTEVDGEQIYLHGNGGITKDGAKENVRVEMPQDLSRYELPNLKGATKEKRAVSWMASTMLITLADKSKTAPMLAATWRSALRSSDFAVHCTGRSGSFKSEVTSLMQSHFGVKMDARNLPGSWNSTANALEALAFRTKDALFVVDDFIPVGTSWQQKAYQKAADQLIRGAGNQQGRARLTDVSSLQQTMYPRGLVMSSGEDTPEGQSLRGRMVIIELSKGDVKPENLTRAQKRREEYPKAMADFIQWIADNREAKLAKFDEDRQRIRDENLGVGHTRTPQMVGDLIAAAEMWFAYGLERGYTDEQDAATWMEAMSDGIKEMAEDQERFISESDPAETFVKVLQSALMSKSAHLAAFDGGHPRMPTLMGWQEFRGGQINDYSPKGPKIGWVDFNNDVMYIDHVVGYETIRRLSSGQISITATTLWKRLKESGIVVKNDEKRQRNTLRVTCEGAVRTVVAIQLSSVIDIDEERQKDDEAPF